MAAFAKALPKIRRRVRLDLQLRGLPKRKVLAAPIRLLEITFVRVDNQEYVKQQVSSGGGRWP